MKKIIYQIFLVGVFLLCSASTVSAVVSSSEESCPAGQICNPLAYDNFEDLIDAIVSFLFNLSLVVAPIMLVIAGILYVTSAVNPKQIETAKNIILYTIIGFSVILLASGLVKVLQSLLGG
ncbi:MAG: pilin [Candidatus Nealsonbacteria bacterium]